MSSKDKVDPPCALPTKARELLEEHERTFDYWGNRVAAKEIRDYLATAPSCACAGLRRTLEVARKAADIIEQERDSLREQRDSFREEIRVRDIAMDSLREQLAETLARIEELNAALSKRGWLIDGKTVFECLDEALRWMREDLAWFETRDYQQSGWLEYFQRRDAILARHDPDAPAERHYCQQCIGSGTHLVDRGGGTWYCPACTWEGPIAEPQAEPTGIMANPDEPPLSEEQVKELFAIAPAEPTPAVCSRCNKPPHTPCSDPECGMYEQPTPEPHKWKAGDWAKVVDPMRPLTHGEIVQVLKVVGTNYDCLRVHRLTGDNSGFGYYDHRFTPCAAPPVLVRNEPVTPTGSQYFGWQGIRRCKSAWAWDARHGSELAAEIVKAIAELERRDWLCPQHAKEQADG